MAPNNLITNFSKIGMPTTETQAANSTQKQRKDTQFWLNVGVERNGVLVSLPMGIPLDELQARAIPSPKTKNPEFRQLRQAEYQLWELMKQQMSTMKPGEEVELPFTVKLRRIDEKEVPEEIDNSENPFAIGSFEVKKSA